VYRSSNECRGTKHKGVLVLKYQGRGDTFLHNIAGTLWLIQHSAKIVALMADTSEVHGQYITVF
jgi:hypothetical protein